MPRQLSFDLATRPALGRADFFVAPANALAVAQVDDWSNWASGKLLLIGPAGSGKTHLAHVFASDSGARVIDAAGLVDIDPMTLIDAALVVEDVDRIAPDAAAQTALFHIHNLLLAEGRRLLLTGRDEPHLWGLTLADLQSRMQGSQIARLEEPDDALLASVLTKLFADRQISPDPAVIPWVLRRIGRSFASAAHVVDQLDTAALAQGRAITVPFARAVLDKSPKTE